MENKDYVNPFIEVHRRVQAAKDHLRKTNEEDAALRRRRATQEAANIIDRPKIGEPFHIADA